MQQNLGRAKRPKSHKDISINTVFVMILRCSQKIIPYIFRYIPRHYFLIRALSNLETSIDKNVHI
jgi:hypothetical protein